MDLKYSDMLCNKACVWQRNGLGLFGISSRLRRTGTFVENQATAASAWVPFWLLMALAGDVLEWT